MKQFALIVAGGSGSRLNHTIPKQFMIMGTRPLLMNTVSTFYQTGIFDEIILVLPASQLAMWEQLCKDYTFEFQPTVIAGGETRFESVRNGLSALEGKEGFIAIHDGVRMFVNPKFISFCIQEAQTKGNAIPCLNLNESLRYVNDQESKILDRNHVRIIQTPQCFNLQEIQKAYANAASSNFTDDASVLENAGHPIHLIDGLKNNIKITYPEDIDFATYLISKTHG